MASSKNANRYTQSIEAIFLERFQEGMTSVGFDRTEITSTASELDIARPKNLGRCALLVSLSCALAGQHHRDGAGRLSMDHPAGEGAIALSWSGSRSFCRQLSWRRRKFWTQLPASSPAMP